MVWHDFSYNCDCIIFDIMKKVIFILGFIIVSFCSYSQSKTDFQKKALAGLTFSFETQEKNIFFVIVSELISI